MQKEEEAASSAAVASGVDEWDSCPEHMLYSKKGARRSKNAVAREKDSHVKCVQYSSTESDSENEKEAALEERASSDVQGQILTELKKMSSRLNAVEQQVAGGTTSYDSSHDLGRSKRLFFVFNMFISQEKNTRIHYSQKNTTHETIRPTKILEEHKVIHLCTLHGEHRQNLKHTLHRKTPQNKTTPSARKKKHLFHEIYYQCISFSLFKLDLAH